MALDNKVKNNGGAGPRGSRWMTRAEVKSGSRRGRRNDDRAQAAVEPEYEPRFVTPAQLVELYSLYHLANVPLAGTRPTKSEKMRWACKAFHEAHPEISEAGAYKDLSNDAASKASF